MTNQEALDEARKRWSADGEPGVRTRRAFSGTLFLVGVYEFGSGKRIFYENGRGFSWEEAFKSADEADAAWRKAKKDPK